MRVLDWVFGLGAVAFFGALASQTATGGLQVFAWSASLLALAAVCWALYVALTRGSELVDRFAPWLWRATKLGFWSVFAVSIGAVVLLVVGWQPIYHAFGFVCLLLLGGALLRALAARGDRPSGPSLPK